MKSFAKIKHFGTEETLTNMKKDIMFGLGVFKLVKKECFHLCTKISVGQCYFKVYIFKMLS